VTEQVRTLFEAEAIAARVEVMAGEIRQAIGEEFVLVGVLKGCFVFIADLMRALDRAGARPRIELMRLSSYGGAKESSGEVRLVGDAPLDFAGQPVLLADDIVDTGLSLDFGRKLLTGRGASRVWTAALLDKPSRRRVEVGVDFIGFEIPDGFVVGYGIDYAERYRHLPFIGEVG
jgi:hypoxanthine phosphoribosyltransferase